LGWVYGSGFPKSDSIGKAIDRAAGAKREVIGQIDTKTGANKLTNTFMASPRMMDVTAPATDAAKRWDGWGTALKPAIEPIILARKPLDGTVANNVLAHGVGGLNIDACRVGDGSGKTPAPKRRGDSASWFTTNDSTNVGGDDSKGRFPANVLLDEHAAKEMDKQSGGTRAEKPSKTGTAGATVKE